MTDGKQVRFAVAGLGLMGQRHCRIIQAVPGARLTAVHDRTAALCEAVALEHSAQCCLTYDQVLEWDQVDAVVICLPSALHAEYGVPAAKAGKHVVTEKPIDAESSAARRLISACAESGVQCAVISQNRFSHGLWRLKRGVAEGIMGQPVLARATVKWFRHDEYYTQSDWRGRHAGERGGALINQAVHSIDTLQWLFGVPEELAGYLHCSRPDVLETEDTAVAVMRFAGGMPATLEACTSAAPGFDEGYEVHSPSASCAVFKGEITYYHHTESRELPPYDGPPDAPTLDAKLQLFFRQYMNIVDAIAGRAPLVVTPPEAVAVVETIEKIYAAARGGGGP